MTAKIQNWSCQRCTFLNGFENDKCKVCDFVNFNSKKKETSFFQKLSTMLTSPLEKLDLAFDFVSSPRTNYNVTADWKCSYCTQLNKANIQFCRWCSFDRQNDAKYLLWTCDRCALKQPKPPFNFKCPLCRAKTVRSPLHCAMSTSMPKLNGDVQYTTTSSDSNLSFNAYHLLENDQSSGGNSKIYKKIVEFCKLNKQSFVDDGFPHSNRSIGSINQLEKRNLSIVWLRPQQIVTREGCISRWSVFNNPEPTDIEQGALGNCWFISALAVVAERPDILEKIVITKEYNYEGVYEIRLCVDGIWLSVVVDDFFPCEKNSRTMIFAVSRMNQLWVSLIEKALAKIYGSYTLLRAGRTIEGLTTLTGAPSLMIDLEVDNGGNCLMVNDRIVAYDLIWAQLLSAREAAFLMGCSCGAGKRNVNNDEYRRIGLMPRHAYSILDVRQLNNYRLLRVRNPWGTFVWLGEWSANWPGWTSELRRSLNIKNSNGFEACTFWISFERFVQYFDTVDIAQIREHQGWTATRYLLNIGWGEGKIKFKNIRITITESTEVSVTVFQRNARTLLDQVDLMVSIHREDPSCCGAPNELVTRSPRKIQASVRTDDVFLSPGDYIIQVLSFLKFSECKTIPGTVVIYSAKKIFTELLPSSVDFMQRALVSLILKEGRIEKALDTCIVRYLTNEFAGLALMVDNVSRHHCVQIESDCENSINVLSSRCLLSTADSIPPIHRQIITVLTHFEPSQSYTVSHRLSQRITSFAQLRDFAPKAPNSQNFPNFLSSTMIAVHAPKPLYLS